MHPTAAAQQLHPHPFPHSTAQRLPTQLDSSTPKLNCKTSPLTNDYIPHTEVAPIPPVTGHLLTKTTANNPFHISHPPSGNTTLAQSLAPASLDEIFSVLTQTQSKSNSHVPTRGLMYPGPLAQAHPAGPMLTKFGTHGCPVSIATNWTLDQLDHAVEYGAHPSAKTVEAATALRTEALQKVDQGFATLVSWNTLRAEIANGMKMHTKISPIAAIPHKSQLFRMILDLSNKGKCRQGLEGNMSVNQLTNTTVAPSHSMNQLGQTLGRIIYAVAIRPKSQGPLLFCKIDIKDGFWRMCVPQGSAENFCYVLPHLPGQPSEDIQIVVPDALQMGWTSSPAFFCAATETARDIAEWLRLLPVLPHHPLETHMTHHRDPNFYQHHFPSLQSLDAPTKRQQFFHLFKVFVDALMDCYSLLMNQS
jgi:hypothetical protein